MSALFSSLIFTSFLLATPIQLTSATSSRFEEDVNNDVVFLFQDDNHSIQSDQERIRNAKLELWRRGAFDLDEEESLLFSNVHSPVMDSMTEHKTLSTSANKWETLAVFSSLRIGPIKESRRNFRYNSKTPVKNGNTDNEMIKSSFWNSRYTKNVIENLRAGGLIDENDVNLDEKLDELVNLYGADFKAAIEKNKEEHKKDCEKSCKSFFCATPETNLTGTISASFHSYSMGSVPPEDFAEDFGFPLDLIKVSKEPFFSSFEAKSIIDIAENEENLSGNEYRSGKYKLGGDWLINLPRTREWFNKHLETTFFPQLVELFPEIISSASVLRAHSVSLLKYNSSHPRTDVHIDNGILAMTIAMTPSDDYVGGGTFFEHMGTDHVLPMDVGHATFRPGSVRHGGHRVISGVRYILGAFLLLEDRVEHVRRLKNRGADLRKKGKLDEAIQHFEWALAINPKCTTCLKDWAEILQFRQQFSMAEEKIRKVLELLEDQDSDALFTLGQVLSEQGRDEESIEAYKKSAALNPEDAELWFNLGIKYLARNDVDAEMKMYERATNIDPNMGGAWNNWGIALGEQRKFDEAETKFEAAIQCCPDIAPKAMLNLALVYQAKANEYIGSGNIEAAKTAVSKASERLDECKPLLDASFEKMKQSGTSDDDDIEQYLLKFRPLRLQCHKLTGQLFASTRDFVSCEKEFRSATDNFPNEPGAWDMLARVLEIQGKTDEAKLAKEKVETLVKLNNAFGR